MFVWIGLSFTKFYLQVRFWNFEDKLQLIETFSGQNFDIFEISAWIQASGVIFVHINNLWLTLLFYLSFFLGLLTRLTHLAAGWGGKDNGFGLSKCCSDDAMSSFPESATTLHFEFYGNENQANTGKYYTTFEPRWKKFLQNNGKGIWIPEGM